MLKGEYKDKFIGHPTPTRAVPNFRRERDMSRSITLGEDSTVAQGEYKEQFVEHPNVYRAPLPRRPREQIRSEGEMDTKTENKMQFVEKTAEKTNIAKGKYEYKGPFISKNIIIV